MNEDDIVKKITSGLKKPDFMISKFNNDTEILNVRIEEDEFLLTTVDTANEGIDFPWDADAKVCGYISAAQSMSDIAASGGDVIGLLTSICVPDELTESYVLEFYRGMKLAAEKAGTFILGGDFNSADDFSVSVTCVGKVKKKEVMKRTGSRIGDYIFVTGEFGRFNSGYFLHHRETQLQDVYEEMFMQDPRLKEGKILGRSGLVNSCIDMPDGFLRCLKLLADGAEVYDESVPLSARAERMLAELNMKRYEMASNPAGDLELIFTVSPENKDIIERLMKKEGCKISCVGMVTDASSIRISGNEIDGVKRYGYTHGSGRMFESGKEIRKKAMVRYQ